MESEEMALINLFSGWQWRNRHREQTYGQVGRREGRRRDVQRVAYKFTIPCEKHIANGIFLYDSGNSNRGSVTG